MCWNAAEFTFHRITQSLVSRHFLESENDSIRIGFSTELVTFSQTDDGVNATIQDLQTESVKEVHLRCYVWCDGEICGSPTFSNLEYTGGDLTSRVLWVAKCWLFI